MTILFLLSILVHLILAKKAGSYAQLVQNRNYFTIIETVTPFLFIVIARFLISIRQINQYVSSPYVLSIGVLSLHFYFISNLLLGLSSITKDSATYTKILGLIGIASLSYMFTYWRFRSKYEIQQVRNA